MIVHAKKKGDYYIVYQDAVTLLPAILQSEKDEPAGALGQMPVTLATLKATYPGAEFVFHEIPTPEQQNNVRKDSPIRVAEQKKLENYKKANDLTAEEEQESKTPTPPPAGGEGKLDMGVLVGLASAFAKPPKEELPKTEVALYGVAMQYFKVLLAKHYANKDDREGRVQAEAAGNFILTLWPNAEADLSNAKQSLESPRFSLL